MVGYTNRDHIQVWYGKVKSPVSTLLLGSGRAVGQWPRTQFGLEKLAVELLKWQLRCTF